MDVVSNREACLDRPERKEMASKIDGLFGNGDRCNLSEMGRR